MLIKTLFFAIHAKMAYACEKPSDKKKNEVLPNFVKYDNVNAFGMSASEGHLLVHSVFFKI